MDSVMRPCELEARDNKENFSLNVLVWANAKGGRSSGHLARWPLPWSGAGVVLHSKQGSVQAQSCCDV